MLPVKTLLSRPTFGSLSNTPRIVPRRALLSSSARQTNKSIISTSQANLHTSILLRSVQQQAFKIKPHSLAAMSTTTPGYMSTADKVRDHVARTFFYDGMVNGDWDKAATVLDDNVVWSVPSESAIGGMWRGKDAVIGLGRQIAEGGVNVGVVRLEYGLEKIAVVLHNHGERDGKVLDEHLTAVFTVEGDKAVYIEAFISDLPMLNAFLPAKS